MEREIGRFLFLLIHCLNGLKGHWAGPKPEAWSIRFPTCVQGPKDLDHSLPLSQACLQESGSEMEQLVLKSIQNASTIRLTTVQHLNFTAWHHPPSFTQLVIKAKKSQSPKIFSSSDFELYKDVNCSYLLESMTISCVRKQVLNHPYPWQSIILNLLRRMLQKIKVSYLNLA